MHACKGQRPLGKRGKYHLFFDGESVINTPGISLILAEKLECVHSTNAPMLAMTKEQGKCLCEKRILRYTYLGWICHV